MAAPGGTNNGIEPGNGFCGFVVILWIAAILVWLSVLLFGSGCLTMGAKLEVKKLLDEREAYYVQQARDAARKEASTRTNEALDERLPGLVAVEARAIAGNRSVEVLESKVPEAVANQLRQAGLTKEFVTATSDDLGAVKESTEATDWGKIGTMLGTGLIAAWLGFREMKGKGRRK